MHRQDQGEHRASARQAERARLAACRLEFRARLPGPERLALAERTHIATGIHSGGHSADVRFTGSQIRSPGRGRPRASWIGRRIEAVLPPTCELGERSAAVADGHGRLGFLHRSEDRMSGYGRTDGKSGW